MTQSPLQFECDAPCRSGMHHPNGAGLTMYSHDVPGPVAEDVTRHGATLLTSTFGGAMFKIIGGVVVYGFALFGLAHFVGVVGREE